MPPIDFLQSWYLAKCNGEWEHALGITIESLDNPGWMVTIDLSGTPLQDLPMPPVRRERAPADWIICDVDHNRFRGQGDAQKLGEIIAVFQQWATNAAETRAPAR